MAAIDYSTLDTEYYTLAEDHDLIVRVIEHTEVTRTVGQGANVRTVKVLEPNKVYQFKVKREVLLKATDYFKPATEGPWVESQQSTIDLHEDSAEIAQGPVVLLQILHATGEDGFGSTFTSTSLRGVWEVLAAADKYLVDDLQFPAAKAWFQGWWAANQETPNWKQHVANKRLDFKDYQALLYPCQRFDNAKAFAVTTKYLVYHGSGHIQEKRPDDFFHDRKKLDQLRLDQLRLDQLVIQQLNAARGRLKTILHRNLYDPIDTLLKHATCDCKEKTLYNYEKALANTHAWPLEQAYLRQSMYQLLEKLRTFPDDVGSESCGTDWCAYHFPSVVQKASSDTKSYFDGLCLDCMDISKPKGEDLNEDYWRHAEHGCRWDSGCRITHGQPTWYFSFMGRREKMIKWTNRNRDRDE